MIVYRVGYFNSGADTGTEGTTKYTKLRDAQKEYNLKVRLVDDDKLDAVYLECARESDQDCWFTIVSYDRENGTDVLPEVMDKAMTDAIIDKALELYWFTPWSDI